MLEDPAGSAWDVGCAPELIGTGTGVHRSLVLILQDESKPRLRTTDFAATFLYTAAPEREARICGKLLIELAPRPGLEPSMWAWLSTPPIQIFLVPCVCLVATSFYRGVHRILKAGVVELPGPLPGPPSIRAAVKAGHHILHTRKALGQTPVTNAPLLGIRPPLGSPGSSA